MDLKHQLITTFFLLTTVITRVECFFQYDNCGNECIEKAQPCTIFEVNKNYFPVQCVDNDIDCELEASSTEVCLRKGKDPIGGEAIWDDFDRHSRTTTTTSRPPTTTTQRPDHGVPTEIYKWYSIISLTATAIYITLKLTMLVAGKIRRRHYQTLSPHDNPDIPYGRTVENRQVENTEEPA